MNWVDVLPSIADAINKSVCRITGKRPIDVDEHNAQDVREQVYGSYLQQRKDPVFKPGDKVRVALSKKIFERGFNPNFTDEIFTIENASNRKPNVYRLRKYNDEVIKGRFYPEQLQKVTEDKETTYRIDKVIRKRKKDGKDQILVKFIGYPTPEWIYSTDIVN